MRKLGFPVVYCHQNAFLEEDNYRMLKKQKPTAVWKRYVPHRSIADEIGRARGGLCLSAEEGAMFVSAGLSRRRSAP